MPSEAIWQAICPICEGMGKVENIYAKTLNNPHRKDAIGVNEKCEVCHGTGKILVCKKIRKKNEDKF